jgi:hypothetical protein
MKHPERIADYLQHIAEAIDRITGYVQGAQGIDNAAALERDHKTQAAVLYQSARGTKPLTRYLPAPGA